MQKKKQIQSRGIATIFNKAGLKFAERWLCKNNSNLRVSEGWIESINVLAACHPRWPKHMMAQNFAENYLQAPDLAAALLNDLRKEWSKLEKSVAGRLKKFLATNTAAKWYEGLCSPAAIKEAEKIREYLKTKQPNMPEGGKSFPVGAQPYTEEWDRFYKLQQEAWANRKHSGLVPDEFGNVSMWALQDAEIATAFQRSPGGQEVTIEQVREARRWVIAEQDAYEICAKKLLDKDGFLQVKATQRRQ